MAESLEERASRGESPADRLALAFREIGRNAEIVDVPDAKVFRQAVVFPDRVPPAGPTVRVYRGIASLESALRQEPYAIRTRTNESDEHLSYMEHARAEMEALAEHPTAERLYAYVDAVWPDLNDAEIKSFERALRDIEDGMLRHKITLRWSLMFEQYKFGSSPRPDSGISPYMPGTLDPRQAADYGRAGVIVLDLPLSAFEAPHNDTRGEVSIRGSMRPEYVSAVMVYTPNYRMETDERAEDLVRSVDRVAPAPLSTRDEDALLSTKKAEVREADDGQREHDVAVIRERRAKLIRTKFADLGVTANDVSRLAAEWKTDVYTATKQALYDVLERRYVASGASEERLSRDTYEDEHWQRLPFDRDAVTDKMLVELQRIVRYYEQRKRDRDEYDRKRSELMNRTDTV